jgi:hypothetical protein
MQMWVTLPDKDYRHADSELKKQRDRGAGIIASAILQDHLLAAIKTRLTVGSEVEANMFKTSGPIGSFGTQIDLGFLLGIYPNYVREQMHLIRLIRNEFAHNVQPVSFRSQRARCAKLNLPKGAGKPMQKVWAEIRKTQTDPGPPLSGFRSSKNPRRQFINATMQLTLLLASVTLLARPEGPWIKSVDQAPQPALLSKSSLRPPPHSQSKSRRHTAPARRP